MNRNPLPERQPSSTSLQQDREVGEAQERVFTLEDVLDVLPKALRDPGQIVARECKDDPGPFGHAWEDLEDWQIRAVATALQAPVPLTQPEADPEVPRCGGWDRVSTYRWIPHSLFNDKTAHLMGCESCASVWAEPERGGELDSSVIACPFCQSRKTNPLYTSLKSNNRHWQSKPCDCQPTPELLGEELAMAVEARDRHRGAVYRLLDRVENLRQALDRVATKTTVDDMHGEYQKRRPLNGAECRAVAADALKADDVVASTQPVSESPGNSGEGQ